MSRPMSKKRRAELDRVEQVALDFVERTLLTESTGLIDSIEIGALKDENLGKVDVRELMGDRRAEEYVRADDLRDAVTRLSHDALIAWRKSR